MADNFPLITKDRRVRKDLLDSVIQKLSPNCELSIDQIEFAFFDALPKRLKPCTVEQWAEEHRYNATTLYDWKNDLRFQKFKLEIVKRLCYDRISNVLGNMVERAEHSADPRWTELYLAFIVDWSKKENQPSPLTIIQNNIVTPDDVRLRLQHLKEKTIEIKGN